jgi:predicted nuclease of predicted toxin-antitoxin system
MPRTIRFHLDEHVDPAIADGLRRRHIDVTTASDAELLGATDEDHLSFANADQRVIVTSDSDFLRLHSVGCPHPGIVYGHQQSRSVGDILRGLELIWEILEPEDIRGRIEFL